MTRLIFIKDRLTKCDSGLTLNPLMHLFLFITLVLSIGFIFFDHTATIQAFTLYQQTMKIDGALDLWGIVGLVTMALHTLGFLIRGRVGVRMMQATIFGGAYLWIWSCVLYLTGGFIFQFLVFALPNLLFWAWYAWQWRRRYNHERVAFV